MNGPIRTAGLAALLTLSIVLTPGCGSEPDADSAGTSTGVETPDSADSGSADSTAASTDATTPPAPPADANRFAPGGAISDADLAKYHVSMACTIDGEDVGTMTFAMWTESAPITTRNFLRLCDEGFYDGIGFHRILRDFMVQGGDPTGTGMGSSPHGTILAEFSDAPERAHGYGVLSMARGGQDVNSASCQFFLCCDESPSVWGLDNQYTSFGRITSGVETLETIADVPIVPDPRGEPSKPTQEVVISKATVVEAAAPTGETIARPEEEVDLGGEPDRIVVQHVLISFQGCGIPGVTRTKEEAEVLANEILEQVRGGADMDALVREKSDDPVPETDETPGHYGLMNKGVRDRAEERKTFMAQNEFRKTIEALQLEVRAGKLTQAEYQKQGTALQSAMMDGQYMPRTGLVPAFGDVGFTLKVGEVGLATFDAEKSPFGFHIIKRLE